LFYVIQKWSEFPSETLSGKLVQALQFTEGGLVVYGGVIGGLIATGLWCYMRGFSYFMLADIVTPAFLLGLAFGRVGCLFNGCCFGAVCLQELPSIEFPSASPPYEDQLHQGELLGAKLSRKEGDEFFVVSSIKPHGWAALQHLKEGDRVQIRSLPDLNHPASPPELRMELATGTSLPLPTKSLPVHPTQVYAAVNAAILSGLLACIPLIYSRRGFVFSCGLILYGISRIIEEFIRVDEAGQFGTSFSIGQWVSFVGILAGCGMIIYVQSRGGRSAAGNALRNPPAIHA
jgi:phosphatidylglycerol:prolipoprotein diacylglycerol transferase